MFVNRLDLIRRINVKLRNPAIDMGPELLQNFRTPLSNPCLCITHSMPALQPQRIGKYIDRYILLNPGHLVAVVSVQPAPCSFKLLGLISSLYQVFIVADGVSNGIHLCIGVEGETYCEQG